MGLNLFIPWAGANGNKSSVTSERPRLVRKSVRNLTQSVLVNCHFIFFFDESSIDDQLKEQERKKGGINQCLC